MNTRIESERQRRTSTLDSRRIGALLVGLVLLAAPAPARAIDWFFVPVTGSQISSSTTDLGFAWELRSTLQITNLAPNLIEDVHLVPYGTCLGPTPVGACGDPATRLAWDDGDARWEALPSWVEAQDTAFYLLMDPAVTTMPVVPGWNYSAGDSLPAIEIGDIGGGQTVTKDIVFHAAAGAPFWWGWVNHFVGKPVVCGDGVLSGGEECDDGNTADGDCCSSTCTIEPAGTVCRTAADTCDATETCDGISDVCPADAALPDGSPCDDGQACTTDTCQAAACVGDPTPDPALTCRAAGKSILVVKEPDASGTRDKVIWKWLKGTTPLAAFGDPSTSDGFDVCIYDETAGALLLAAAAPAGGSCSGAACWKAAGSSGWKYKDKALTPDGLLLASLKAGDGGKSKIIVKGKGPNLALPALPPAEPVDVTARLIGGAGDCWESTFADADVQKSDTKTFKAKSQ